MNKDIPIFLFILGVILFNWPFLMIFKESLAPYLFMAWFAFIGLVWLATVRSRRDDGGD